MSVRFAISGRYRVQSKVEPGPATLSGSWLPDDDLMARAIDRALAASTLRVGGGPVLLRTAVGVARTGVFAACPDVLYKRELFVADRETPGLDHHVVDLDKALARWDAVVATLDRVWADPEGVRVAVRCPAKAIRREYFVHEAGHKVGIDVDAKVAAGHFRPGGRLRWPLVYVEEARADLHALALAADLFAPADAVAVLYEHAAVRFGMHRMRGEGEPPPFGLVPYLTYVALREVGLLSVVRTPSGERFALRSEARDVVAAMRACGAWAAERLTVPELRATDPLERAIVGARHVRECLDRPHARAEFARICGEVDA